MKIELEIPDLEEIYLPNYSYDDECEINGTDMKKALAEIAIEKLAQNIYNNYIDNKVCVAIRDSVYSIMKEHSKEIVDTVIDRVTQEILQRKAIKNEMPKKSELTEINKDWENYFTELIDKAIAKRFR
ncbi:hypothetical protein [Clostridium sp. AF32-12BH]|uniref:hypothetical protein n=1 Tax=Clostridium sp. AF32-12BH TaxID=2292006 RepID=UPI000E491756|nr:hypothetical protein [Clostridium sp. AF32-12BH]RHP46949.1 hypothetical protein DWZ40_08570 [Clostridium sp. AF32-12BH]